MKGEETKKIASAVSGGGGADADRSFAGLSFSRLLVRVDGHIVAEDDPEEGRIDKDGVTDASRYPILFSIINKTKHSGKNNTFQHSLSAPPVQCNENLPQCV